MCGILGIQGNNLGKYGDQEFDSMLATLSHRGPDDRGTLKHERCLLAQTRLSIIDIAGGHQPMRDADGRLSITFNGEIYNYKDLRRELKAKGHAFVTNSDTEVILKAYTEYGDDCPKRLDGMFAFAIWDARHEKLFLARDRFGKKPLYHALDRHGNFVFASEIKAILAGGVIGKLDRGALDNYLALMYVPPWKSIYSNVHQLPPAHSATWGNGVLTKRRYWSMPHAPLSVPYEEAKEETRRLLEEAVKKRMFAADVEVGALLSGGVDSTLVSIFASKHIDHPLKTFSLGYGEYINELPYAKKASEKIGSEHYTLQAGGDLTHELEEVLESFDEPHADSSDFPQHLISRLAAEKVKVALSGDGADEIFMGYGWHTRHLFLSYRAHAFEKLFLDPFEGRVRATRIFTPIERLLMQTPRHFNNDIYAGGAYPDDLSAVEKMVMYDLTTYLPGQLLYKVDRTSMMHGLEVRSPFLDTALAEFAFNLPLEYKSGKDGTKLLLKELLAEHMPHDFVYRRKQGFGAPVGKWLREQKMRYYVERKLGKDAVTRTLFPSSLISFYLHHFYAKGSGRFAMRLWTLLCLEVWLQSHKNVHTL